MAEDYILKCGGVKYIRMDEEYLLIVNFKGVPGMNFCRSYPILERGN